MKKPFILKTLYLLFLPLICISAIAQTTAIPGTHKRFGIDADMGTGIPLSKDIHSIFYAGFNISVGGKMAVLHNKKLWIKPVAGCKVYSKMNGGSDANTTETFTTVKAGIELQYLAVERRRYAFYPLLRVDHNWSKNYFSKTSDVSQVGNVQIYHVSVSDDYLKGKGYAFDAGCMIVSKSHWYLRADYEYYRPSLKVYPDLVKEALAQGIYMPSTVELNCSTINLSLGCNFNFR